MRIHQYAYFSIASQTMAAEDVAARVGLAADRISVRGSRREVPPVPVCHRWYLDVEDRSSRLDEQVEHLVARLSPHRDRIRAVVEELSTEELSTEEGAGSGAALVLVRDFDHEDGVLDRGQHRLLGWVLSEEVVAFLADAHACVDVDEYGADLAWYQDLPGGAGDWSRTAARVLRRLRPARSGRRDDRM